MYIHLINNAYMPGTKKDYKVRTKENKIEKKINDEFV